MNTKNSKNAFGTIRFTPATEDGLLALVVRHQLTEVDITTLCNKLAGENGGIVSEWFAKLGVNRQLRLMVDKAGLRWLVTKNPCGMIEYAKIEGVLKKMGRDKASGDVPAGESLLRKKGRFDSWLKSEAGRLA